MKTIRQANIQAKITDKHDQLRQILIDANCPEYGDLILDEICELFNYPDTNMQYDPQLTAYNPKTGTWNKVRKEEI